MPSGNGAKAQQKRERNLKRNEGASSAKSQLKTNEAAKTTICNICRASFLCTAKETELRIHSDNKHPKNKFEECFPAMASA
ncbi:hypothetical protein DDB_G0275367 [Dictyostelium discoideum AX4]|uniref:Uncharacterized protein n=1 Tax=Dictyostelium discoideum TaxID=44689 RepID=Q553T6_DICDI|nr:hypothetical protein DDB_G0275367 [Dictyostelium discoideum AX4]EAL69749.1 hypothetical protein DDB_G0275367 [Dictyostelium discoideum AX4]|eukprot:XP_643685.1 hypothetical protein DDB_G0275367 [Dictyostelium discoideum AX4]